MYKNYSVEEFNKNLPSYSRWTILSIDKFVIRQKTKKFWKVIAQCKCGTIKSVWAIDIHYGKSQSCGCHRNEVATARCIAMTKYKNSVPQIKSAYYSMLKRCYDKNNKNYRLYGGRGVTVCDEWRNNYQTFLDWCLNNGWKKGLHLDKDIKGNSKLYSPDTCIFVTPMENSNNKSNNIKYRIDGQYLTLSQVCRMKGLCIPTIRDRVNIQKMSFERAIEIGTGRVNKVMA